MHDAINVRLVRGLKVHVHYSESKERLEWIGELRDLYEHLDPAKEQREIAVVNTVVGLK